LGRVEKGAIMRVTSFARLAALVLPLCFASSIDAAITTTNYSVTGTFGSGDFSLDFDDATSLYTLSALNLTVGTTFDLSDAVIEGTVIGGTPGGAGIVVGGTKDFSFFVFDPTATTQATGLGFSFAGASSPGSAATTAIQTGSSGTITDYSISGDLVSGTLSLDYDSASSSYSLTTLDLFVGTTFDASEAAIVGNVIGGTPAGAGIVVGGVNDFSFFVFDPTAASQTVGMGFSIASAGIGSDTLTITQVAASPAGVPEPSTWAFMLLGFGVIGFSMRRARSQLRLSQLA
jgi:PEP-CTERM motif-containing protein